MVLDNIQSNGAAKGVPFLNPQTIGPSESIKP
jgi:hypothetical protein